MIFYQDFSPRTKQVARGLGVALLAGLMLASFALAYSYFISGWSIASNTPAPRQISVSGEGKVAARPDIAVFTAGVITQEKTVKDAQENNASRSNAIAEFLKERKIEDKDVKTVTYAIQPQYQYDNRPCIQVYPNPCPTNPPRIVSYEVRHTLEVKIRDLEKVDEALSGVVQKGANEVGSIQFKIDEEEKVLAEARKKAIEDAKEKARILARDLGVRLGKIVSFNDSSGPIFRSAFETFGKGGGGDMAFSAPQVAPGEQEVRSFVTIVYELK